MGFDIRKPGHIIGLILLLVSFYFLFIDPILSYLDVFSLTRAIGFTEIMFLSLFITILLVLTPFLWYFFVDKYSFKEILQALKLHSRDLDRALLWGVLTAIFMFVIIIVMTLVLVFVAGVDQDAITGVTETAAGISVLSLLLIIFQAISAEIYLRGFLLEKINSFAGSNMAIMVTSVLFGLVHLSYGEIYPAIIPIFLGIVLGYVVLKTKSLYSAITAQIFFNITSFILYTVVQSIVGSLVS